jgi:predicted nucleotidyltransferase
VTPDVLDRVRRATRSRPSAALAEHKLQVLDIVHAHRGSRVRLIGSAARGEDTSDSDLDLLITLDPEADLLDQIAIAQELEDLLGVEVDIVDEASVRGPVGDRIRAEAVAV